MYKTREELLAMTNEERIAYLDLLLNIFQQMTGTLYRTIIANEIVECFNTIDLEPLPKEVVDHLNKRLSFITYT